MEDSYFFLLEQPRQRQFGLCGERLLHRTPSFDPVYYAAANGLTFDHDEEAYRDWRDRGRRAGLAYAEGRDTVLKIILKAKDEPELLPVWIRHHAAIVGMENLVILDCGSTDPAYRALLDTYADRLLILRYPLYYDYIHAPQSNRGFFDLLARNCRYLTILDADEFLVGRKGDDFSAEAVKPLLVDADEPVFAGTWVAAVASDAGRPAVLDIAAPSLAAGTMAGKSIVRSEIIGALGHLGHNMHDASVLGRLTPGSFGKLQILHLTLRDPAVARRRALAHLRSQGLIANDIDEDTIRALSISDDAPDMAREYARRYCAAMDASEPTGHPTDLIGGSRTAHVAPLAEALDRIDYLDLVRQQTVCLR